MDAVLVRFKATPTDDEVQRIADEAGLGDWLRNEFTDRQVYFQVPQGYSPKLLLKIKSSPGVEMAWEDKLSEYRRQWSKKPKPEPVN
jgi:hypothetical protein